MTNTINNVPRELLEEVMLAAQRMPVRGPSIRAKLHALLSAPSPDGVDGLEVRAYEHVLHMELGQKECFFSEIEEMPFGVKGEDFSATYDVTSEPLCRLSDALAAIAVLDARIVELESRYQRDVYGLNNEGDPIGGDPAGGYANDNARLRAELSAIKTQEPVQVDHVAVMRADGDGGLEVEWLLEGGTAELMNGMYLCCVGGGTLLFEEGSGHLYAAPVSEAKAQGVVMPERDAVIRKAVGMCNRIPGSTTWNAAEFAYDELAARITAAPVQQAEYGDAYQGAREDLAIWKRRTLEAEEKVRQQEQIIDHLTSEAQGESRFGEPVITAGEPCVPDGYVLADKKSLGMVLQALVNAPHHIRELQATRQPVELFSDNPINVLIANYEAPAAPAAPAADASHVFYGMDGNHP